MAARLRDIALSLLGQHRVPTLLVERVARQAEVATLEAALAAAEHRVPLADRAIFFHESPAEAEVARCEERLRVAREALATSLETSDRATRSVWAACPPVEIAHRAESVIATALANPRVGRAPSAEALLIGELETLAERVAEVWAPEVDLIAVAERLLDDAFRARSSAPLGPPRTDDPLGWAPVSEAELAARAAQALEARGFRELRAAVVREASEFEAMAARVSEARKAIREARRSEREIEVHRTRWLEGILRQEEQEAIAASEAELHAVVFALGTCPPIAVMVAARAVAGVLHAGPAKLRAEQGFDGQALLSTAGYLRALLLAALIELRRAVDAAFPGVSDLVAGRVSGAAARPPLPLSDAERALFAELEQQQLRPLLSRGVAHATMLGVLAEEREEPGWLARMVAAAIPVDRGWNLGFRAAWHRRVVHGLGEHALTIVHRNATRDPIVALRWLAADAQTAVAAVHLDYRNWEVGWEHRPPKLVGVGEAVAAVDKLGIHLGHTFGLRGGYHDLVVDLIQELQRPSPGGQRHPEDVGGHQGLVQAIAARARGTDLLALLTFVERRARELEMTRPPRPPAFPGSSVWVALSARARARQRSVPEHREVWDAVDRASMSIGAALLSHPPAVLYYDLFLVRGEVAAIDLEWDPSGMKGTKSRLLGRDTAIELFHPWSRRLDQVFGMQPTLSWLLERFVRRELE